MIKHQICINLLLKLVPNKYTIYSIYCLENYNCPAFKNILPLFFFQNINEQKYFIYMYFVKIYVFSWSATDRGDEVGDSKRFIDNRRNIEYTCTSALQLKN